MTARVSRRACLVLASCVFVAACDNDSVTSPSEVISPTTVNWTTQVGPAGAASRSFVATQSGTVTVTLQSAPLPVGLGIGVPRSGGSGCRPSSTTTALPGSTPQLASAVESGTYCLVVFDVGGIVDPVAFSVQFVHP